MLRANGPAAGGQVLPVHSLRARGVTDFEHGRERNILLGCDSFVSMAPARVCP